MYKFVGRAKAQGQSKAVRRAALLCTTALASTMLLGGTNTASAQQALVIVASPVPVNETNFNNCNSALDCIFISTLNNQPITLTNFGPGTAAAPA